MSVVCVASYYSVEEALVAKSKLEFYGIPVCFSEEYAVRNHWVYLQWASGCHLEVPASCVEDALYLLQAVDEIEPEEADQIEPDTTLRFWVGLALILSMGYFGLFPLLDRLWQQIKKRC